MFAVNITNSANSIPITSITYIDNGSTVVQNSSTNSNDDDPEPVLLELISLQGGVVLDEFNTGVVTAVSLNFAPSSGFDAYLDNQTINSTNGPAFTDAVRSVYSNRNLRDYINKASSANANNPNGDYDIFYQFSLSNDDYIVMAERDGNSAISLQALDANGNVIAGSETLDFQGGGNAPFQWDTGYRSSQDGSGSSQTLELAVVDISEFDTNDNIFGLRIINNSGADNKLFIASDDTFTNNVPNPTVAQPPAFTVVKFVQVDDGNSNPGDDFYVPGSELIYRVVVTNGGTGSPDPDSFVFTDDLPDEVDLFVGDFAGGGGGPVDFDDGSQTSGLTYSFVSLGDGGDSITFLDSGGSSITPDNSIPGSANYDPAVRAFEVRSTTNFAPWSGSGNQPSFEIEYRVRLR